MKLLTLRPEALGLDIFDVSLKLAKLEKRKKGFYLSSFLKKNIEPGIIEKGEIKNEEALIKALKSLITEVKGEPLGTKYVVASLPEEKSFSQVIEMPFLKGEELKEAVRFEAENYIPFPINEVYLDSQIVEPLDHLKHLEVLITAVPKATVDSYVSCLKKAGLFPLALEVESQAIARALVKDEITTFPELLLDIGATRTSFIIFSGHSLRFSSSIPVAAREFTKALARNLKIDIKEAEKLKLRYGLLGPKKVKLRGKRKDGIKFERKVVREEKFFEALIPVLTDFTEQVKKRIDYYLTHASHEHLPSDRKGVERVLLCGGGANLKGLDKFLSSELKAKVELGNPWVNILPEGEKETPQISFEESLSYTTALGLALRGVKT